jgi:hypothetical protein
MMAFSNDFVCTILFNGKPLREFNEGGKRVCRIPFGTEYSIKLKNKSLRRALVSISIDGTDVFTGARLELGVGETKIVERFVDKLDSGNKFKFISVEEGKRDGSIQDPTSEDNGRITVQFYPEIERKIRSTSFSNLLRGASATTSYPFDYMSTGSSSGFTTDSSSGFTTDSSSGFTTDATTACCMALNSVSDSGATVEGSRSSQAFAISNNYFEVESTPVQIDLWLKGSIMREYASNNSSGWRVVTEKNLSGYVDTAVFYKNVRIPAHDVMLKDGAITFSIPTLDQIPTLGHLEAEFTVAISGCGRYIVTARL